MGSQYGMLVEGFRMSNRRVLLIKGKMHLQEQPNYHKNADSVINKGICNIGHTENHSAL